MAEIMGQWNEMIFLLLGTEFTANIVTDLLQKNGIRQQFSYSTKKVPAAEIAVKEVIIYRIYIIYFFQRWNFQKRFT